MFIDEFAQTARAERSVIVYQHLGQRDIPRPDFLIRQLERLADARPGYEILAVEGPLAAALCAEPPGTGKLLDAAKDLARAWPSDGARVIERA